MQLEEQARLVIDEGMEVLYNSSILWGVKKGCCTDSRFTTDFTTDAGKICNNMPIFAKIRIYRLVKKLIKSRDYEENS